MDQTSLTPTPPQPAVPPLAETSNRRWPVLLIGGFVILALGIAIGIFSAKFLNQSSSPSQISSYEDCLAAEGSTIQENFSATCVTAAGQFFNKPVSSSAQESVVPTPDPAAGWKTYTNNDLNFSFRYPSELIYIYDQINDYANNSALSGNLLIENFDGSKPRQETAADFQVALWVSRDDGKTLLEDLARDAQSSSTQTLTIGGKNAVRGTSIQKYEQVPTVWVRSDGDLFTIQLSTPNSTNTAWFDQILSTFKFSD